MQIVTKIKWFLFVSIMAISCLDQPDCYQLSSDQIGITFKVLGTNKTDSVSLQRIEIEGSKKSYYHDATLINGVLPLNYLKDETAITIVGKDINDVSGTLLLKYLSEVQFVSDECGPRYILSDLSIANQSGFDSVHVVASQPNNPPIINIEIYRCPINNLVKLDYYQLYIAPPNKKTSQPLAVNINNITTEYSGQVSYQNAITNTVTLPINLAASPSNFSMTIDGNPNDVSLRYVLTNTTRYNACGEQTYASALQVTSLKFDSVSIATTITNNIKKPVDAPQDPAVTNVLIFLCPKTNLMKVAYKTPKGESTVSLNVSFDSITNNFSSTVFYKDVTTNLVELPINEASLESEYYFRIKSIAGSPSIIDTVRVSYAAIKKTLFNACKEQSVHNKLQVTSSNIIAPNQILVPKDSLQFPSVTNIEIIKIL